MALNFPSSASGLSKRLNNLPQKPSIGLALGSGASRGWSHVGIIKALSEAGIEPDVVCGTSVGAMVGAAYATGRLDKLRSWVLGSTRGDVLRFFDVKLSQAGLVNVERWTRFLHTYVAAEDVRIEDLAKKYVAVATDFDTGREVWFREGLLAEAVRASMAMPGLYPAVRDQQRWLVDGGLVNPVPVNACRALGAEVVIAVNLNSDIMRRAGRKSAAIKHPDSGMLASLKQQARDYSSNLFPHGDDKAVPPGMLDVVSGSINIFQDRITRSRLAGDPADIVISPRLGDMGILEFQRAGDAMKEGEDRVNSALPDIHRAIELTTRA